MRVGRYNLTRLQVKRLVVDGETFRPLNEVVALQAVASGEEDCVYHWRTAEGTVCSTRDRCIDFIEFVPPAQPQEKPQPPMVLAPESEA